ncbi:MAG: hypothetical protein KAZ18_06370 [Acinetobacter sp.]|nr:hypothetical protein [Acinetobacter sp.]
MWVVDKFLCIFILLAGLFVLTSCSKENQHVLDGDESIRVNIGDRIFLVPKKYIESPAISVERKLSFDENGSMIVYFYWPKLLGLTDRDEQQRFGRFNHQVIQMQWFLLSKRPNSTKMIIDNIKERADKIKECNLSGTASCEEIVDVDFYKLVGILPNNENFYIRCPLEKKAIFNESVCNFRLDYEEKDIYVEGLISSNFIHNGEFVGALNQINRFLNEWELVE